MEGPVEMEPIFTNDARFYHPAVERFQIIKKRFKGDCWEKIILVLQQENRKTKWEGNRVGDSLFSNGFLTEYIKTP